MKYDIWSEGYLATGMEGYPAHAQLVASDIEGDTFIEACKNWAKANPGKVKDWGGFTVSNGYAYLWGCRLFPTEVEARKSFG